MNAGGVILGLAYLMGLFALVVMLGRRCMRFVRQVPPATAGARDTAVLRHRFTRVVFGLALLSGLAMTIVDASHGTPGFSRDLLLLWPWAALAAVAAALIAPLVARRAEGDAWATSSIVLPVVGLALVLPLTLQNIAFHCAGESSTSFDDWCGLALVGSAVTHLVFATLFCVRAISLARSGTSPVSISEVFFYPTLAGAIPFFILGIGVTAATGLAILPVIACVDWLARREHAATSSALPRAIVAPCRG